MIRAKPLGTICIHKCATIVVACGIRSVSQARDIKLRRQDSPNWTNSHLKRQTKRNAQWAYVKPNRNICRNLNESNARTIKSRRSKVVSKKRHSTSLAQVHRSTSAAASHYMSHTRRKLITTKRNWRSRDLFAELCFGLQQWFSTRAASLLHNALRCTCVAHILRSLYAPLFGSRKSTRSIGMKLHDRDVGN